MSNVKKAACRVTNLLLALAVAVSATPAFANGRQPCDRGAGGISHCSGTKFVCKNGKISGSKKTCDARVHGTAPAR